MKVLFCLFLLLCMSSIPTDACLHVTYPTRLINVLYQDPQTQFRETLRLQEDALRRLEVRARNEKDIRKVEVLLETIKIVKENLKHNVNKYYGHYFALTRRDSDDVREAIHLIDEILRILK